MMYNYLMKDVAYVCMYMCVLCIIGMVNDNVTLGILHYACTIVNFMLLMCYDLLNFIIKDCSDGTC